MKINIHLYIIKIYHKFSIYRNLGQCKLTNFKLYQIINQKLFSSNNTFVSLHHKYISILSITKTLNIRYSCIIPFSRNKYDYSSIIPTLLKILKQLNSINLRYAISINLTVHPTNNQPVSLASTFFRNDKFRKVSKQYRRGA